MSALQMHMRQLEEVRTEDEAHLGVHSAAHIPQALETEGGGRDLGGREGFIHHKTCIIQSSGMHHCTLSRHAGMEGFPRGAYGS